MRESVFEKKFTKIATDIGWMTMKLAGIKVGMPDRLFLKENSILFVEFKATGKTPTRAQKLMHGKLLSRGFDIILARPKRGGAYEIKPIRNSVIKNPEFEGSDNWDDLEDKLLEYDYS